jgi:hypothetical protein
MGKNPKKMTMILLSIVGAVFFAGQIFAQWKIFKAMPPMYLGTVPLPTWIPRLLDLGLCIPYILLVIFLRSPSRQVNWDDRNIINCFQFSLYMGLGVGFGLGSQFLLSQHGLTNSWDNFFQFANQTNINCLFVFLIALVIMSTTKSAVDTACFTGCFALLALLAPMISLFGTSFIILTVIYLAVFTLLQLYFMYFESTGNYSVGIGIGVGAGLGYGLLTGMVNGYLVGIGSTIFFVLVSWIFTRLRAYYTTDTLPSLARSIRVLLNHSGNEQEAIST